ncbi:MAG: hypothetical protein ACTSR8_13890 [Promethearchaeota archaeon]
MANCFICGDVGNEICQFCSRPICAEHTRNYKEETYCTKCVKIKKGLDYFPILIGIAILGIILLFIYLYLIP